MAYFIDGMGDLLKEMFKGMGLKELEKKALDRRLPVDVRLGVVDLMLGYGDESFSHLEKVAKKGEGEVASYAQQKLSELKVASTRRGSGSPSKA